MNDAQQQADIERRLRFLVRNMKRQASYATALADAVVAERLAYERSLAESDAYADFPWPAHWGDEQAIVTRMDPDQERRWRAATHVSNAITGALVNELDPWDEEGS